MWVCVCVCVFKTPVEETGSVRFGLLASCRWMTDKTVVSLSLQFQSSILENRGVHCVHTLRLQSNHVALY